MDSYLYIEVPHQVIKERHPVNIRVKVISRSIGQDKNRPEEINEHGIDYGVMIETCLDVCVALA